jgi:hypothetical protein
MRALRLGCTAGVRRNGKFWRTEEVGRVLWWLGSLRGSGAQRMFVDLSSLQRSVGLVVGIFYTAGFVRNFAWRGTGAWWYLSTLQDSCARKGFGARRYSCLRMGFGARRNSCARRGLVSQRGSGAWRGLSALPRQRSDEWRRLIVQVRSGLMLNSFEQHIIVIMYIFANDITELLQALVVHFCMFFICFCL